MVIFRGHKQNFIVIQLTQYLSKGYNRKLVRKALYLETIDHINHYRFLYNIHLKVAMEQRKKVYYLS
jgi:hypothetical protein